MGKFVFEVDIIVEIFEVGIGNLVGIENVFDFFGRCG